MQYLFQDLSAPVLPFAANPRRPKVGSSLQAKPVQSHPTPQGRFAAGAQRGAAPYIFASKDAAVLACSSGSLHIACPASSGIAPVAPDGALSDVVIAVRATASPAETLLQRPLWYYSVVIH